MNAIDGTEHYERVAEGPPPSLLVIILDTNPHAWSFLSPIISLSSAIANILVFINAHLAFNHSNRVAIVASHCQRTAWLYPSSAPASATSLGKNGTQMLASASIDANKYRPFAVIEAEILKNLRELLASTAESELASTTTTMIAGALTLALSYINRVTLALSPNTASGTNPTPIETATSSSGNSNSATLNSRILIVSTSGDLAAQYIPIMNLIFAAQHSRIPIDILKLAGDTILLQQASYTTSGVFLSPFPTSSTTNSNGASSSPTSSTNLLPTLLFAYLPDAAARAHLVPATNTNIDFRAACFCHRRVVDLGFVCSICLSIFCTDAMPLQEDECLTCGTKLRIEAGVEGANAGAENGAGRKKKKRKKVDGGE